MPSTLSAADLQRLERSLYDAIVSQDMETLDKLTSDKLRYMHTQGKSESKKEFLADRQQKKSIRKAESFNPLNFCCEGMAVVSNTVHITIVPDGKSENEAWISRLLITYVWVEEPQGWRLAIRQAVRLPES